MHAVILICSAAVIVAVDQATKSAVVWYLPQGKAIDIGSIALRQRVNIAGWRGSSHKATKIILLWLVEFTAFVALVQFTPWFNNIGAATGLGIALGGAAGNIADRYWRHGVIDFIDLKIWPVFNLADLAIVIGSLIAIIHI